MGYESIRETIFFCTVRPITYIRIESSYPSNRSLWWGRRMDSQWYSQCIPLYINVKRDLTNNLRDNQARGDIAVMENDLPAYTLHHTENLRDKGRGTRCGHTCSVCMYVCVCVCVRVLRREYNNTTTEKHCLT